MQAFVSFFRTLGASRIIAMGAVTIALMAFFAFLIVRVTAPQMTPLFTDLSVEDSSAIIKDLERQGIPYDIKNDGAIVLVPREQVPRLRMKLAEGGLPKGGGVGYEIFDKSDALGATSFVQNINHLRALEGELARTIRAIDRVQPARVHLVLPERPLFSRDKAEPSASIVLKVRGTLEAQQVRAIRHLVASRRQRPQAAAGVGGRRDRPAARRRQRRRCRRRRHRRRTQARLRAAAARAGRIDRHLGGRPGPRPRAAHRRFRLQPHHPDLRQVRSRRPRGALEPDPRGGHGEQRSQRRQRSRSATNCPAPTPGPEAQQQRDQNRKTEEIVNYEISRTTKTEVIEGGRINRISVAVVVDGIYAKNDKGELTYQPRSKEEIDRIAALVRSAIGFDQKRGDQVEVANLRLAETPSHPDQRADRLDELSCNSPRTTSCTGSSSA